ncbi:uncharacterized protein [Nicotiana tomentosiformis]|uniref:uncharacterized protein n=1 Tax=Nicotiana tomentosiformis TaxID=4098 RepID=UPI00388C7F3D
MCMIRSLLNKTPYELLSGRKPKLTHLRTFGCKCFFLNNRKEALGKFDAKSDEGIFLGYSSHSKAYKVYNKRTQCVEESIHMICDESHLSCEKDKRVDQDGEPLSFPGEVIDMENGKENMMNHVKESRKDDTNRSPSFREEPGPTITPTEAEIELLMQSKVPNWKHKSSHPLDNIITPLDSGVQTRSRARNSLAFSAPLSQIEPKNIKEALKDADWITTMQEELHQFERNKVYVDNVIFGATTDSLCEEFEKLMGSEFEMSMMGKLNFFLGLQVKQSHKGTLISQQNYIKELLKRFHMEASKVIDTPIAIATRLDMDEPGFLVNQTMYRGIIGSLLYLTTSRPDIVFNVGLCARFQSNPKESHLKGAKRILRYLKGTQDLVLYYPSGDSFYLIGYADADYAGYLGTRKQNSVALSTAEAEYVASASCCAQSLWIKQQLEDFGVFSDYVDMHDDYRSNRQLMQFTLVKRAKLIDARFVREPDSSDTTYCQEPDKEPITYPQDLKIEMFQLVICFDSSESEEQQREQITIISRGNNTSQLPQL